MDILKHFLGLIGVFVLVGAFLLFGAYPASAHPPGHQPTITELAIGREVMDLRDQIRAAITAKDIRVLVESYTADFTHTHGSAKVDNRDARIVTLLAGEPAIETAPLDELMIRVHGTTTVIVSGRSPIKSLADSKTYDFRWTQVFVKAGNRWQLAVSQATRLPAPSN
jgi:ketosteroid isomerase-like protein